MGSIRLSFFLVIFTCFFELSTCRSLASRSVAENSPLWRRQHGGVFSVLGIVAFGDGTPHPRLEIRELEKDKDQWNVFLLGLHRFQNVDQDDELSYYKIAGIHGMPFESWDGVDGAPGISDGYCPHRHHLFPLWHRPYLALVEEVIFLNAREAVSEFPDGDLKTRYKSSLSTWRLPYWDWAAVPPSGQSCYPQSVQTPTVEIITPNGPQNVSNPLLSYTFHPLPDWSFDSNWQGSESTVRQPEMRAENYTDYKTELQTTHDDATNTTIQTNKTVPFTATRMVRNPKAPSRNDVVAKNLDGNRQNIQLRVYNLLAFEHDYLKMSSEVQGPNNIENIHGTIHNTVGGNAHMWNLRYSAFDPIFWLHHSNVDRLFAIWEALNPTYSVPSYTNKAQTFTMPAGVATDGDTPLKPFHRSESGSFWTANLLHTNYTATFTYTYSILTDVTPTDTLIRRVNELYSPKQSPTHAKTRRKVDTPHHQGGLRERASSAIAAAVAFGAGVQYTFSVEARQSSLEGSPSVLVYLRSSADGGESEEENGPLFVGQTSFVQQVLAPVDTVTDADADGYQSTVRSEVPLTAALEARFQSGELGGLDAGTVKGYLNQWLEWQIVKADGKPISANESSGFGIAVMWREIQPAMSLDVFPLPKGDLQVLMQQNSIEANPGRFV